MHRASAAAREFGQCALRKTLTVPPMKGQLVSSPFFCQSPAMEVVFSITQEADGGFVGECLSHDIFTQGDSWDELRANVKEAVDAYFFDQPKPASIRLHLVRDEVLAVA